jgi:hypothetical protein
MTHVCHAPRRTPGNATLLCALLLALGACGGEGSDTARQPETPGTVEAPEGAALEEAPAGIVDDGPVNITFDPIEIPATDFANAAVETEPNGEEDTATPMSSSSQGAGPADVHFTATGQLTENDNDYFSFTVEVEPQLYMVEAEGEGVERLTLYDAGGLVRRGMETVKGESGRQTITNLYLAPGDYRVLVERFRGADALDYALRIVPLGPVDPSVEREPNDDPTVAERLEFGIVRRGLLYEDGDTDYYRFSLASEDLVSLRLDPPPEITPFLALHEGFPTPATQNRGAEPGMPVEYTALLQPGDYIVRVMSRGGASQAPYALSLRRLNRFSTPIDLEPNDGPHQARPLGRDGFVEGQVGAFGDSDWYAFPEIAPETELRIGRAEESDRPHLRLAGTPRIMTGEGNPVRLNWEAADSVWTAVLPSSETLFLEIRGDGDYAALLEFDPEPANIALGPGGRILDVSVEAPADPVAFAAFWDRWQTAQVPVTVRNDGTATRRLTVDVASTHRNWVVELSSASLDLGPGEQETLTANLSVAPDAPSGWPVQLAVGVTDAEGRRTTASVPSFAACSLDPRNPGNPWTLPPGLLGGLNVAWTGLGGRISRAPQGSSPEFHLSLIDGVTPNDGGWYVTPREYPVDVTLELAGEGPLPLSGVILNPQSESRSESLIRAFEIHLSTDGQEFTRVLEGEMSQARVPQPFVLPSPVEARFARLRILSSWNPNDPTSGRASLGELAVIAVPGTEALGSGGFNLADPAVGGYVARSAPAFSLYPMAERMLTEEIEAPRLDVDPLNPTEWVIGFHHNRAAQIREIQWVDGTENPRQPRFETVQLSASLSSPVGPWEPLGTWSLDRSSGQPASFVLGQPVWARFIRFVSTDAVGSNTRRWQVPETLRVLERGTDAEYRSILGEWGHYSPRGIYEFLSQGEEPAEKPRAAAGNDRRDQALELRQGTRYADGVERGVRVAWYQYDVPKGENRLRFAFRGSPSVDVAATLENKRGDPVPMEEIETPYGLALEAEVEGGETYWLQVAEPLRHIVVAWDNSGSVRPFSPVIYRALSDFTRRLRPGMEYVKLLPFSQGGFLMPEWSDQTLPLVQALQGYNRRDDDSNAEEYLLTASHTLSKEEGVRAVILIADAETFSYDLTADLWESLGKVRPRVFTLELHRGDGAAYQQDLMQSWATVNDGHYAYFAGESDLDEAFDRAFCLLRRPVRYTIEAESRYETPPPPGLLAVELEEGVFASNAVELILDASGSMLQRIGDKRRIDIARDVLTELVSETLPEGVPLAFRVFGHRTPDACDTDLEIPLRPLDRIAVTEVIRRTEAMNLARTPIGESLRLVGEDLEEADGQRLVVLITDGEETCDGDPAASIRFLKDEGLDVRVNIVGLAIDDETLKSEFEEWARLGGGLYFDASSEEELGQALEQALRPKFQVLGPAGDVVAEGTVGSDPVSLPVGVYTVNVLGNPIQVFTNVQIQSEQEQRLTVGGES